MRRLMWFTIGFAIACGLCAWLWLVEGLLLPALLLGAVSILAALGGRRVKFLRLLAALALGTALGLGWFQLFAGNYLGIASAFDGQQAQVTARCIDYGYQNEYGTLTKGVLYLEGKPFLVRLYVNGQIDTQPGDVLTGVFRISLTTPGGYAESAINQGYGYFLTARQVEDAELTRFVEDPIWTLPARLAHRLKGIINAAFPADAAGFAKALLLGDKTDIDYETDTAFKVSGISHIIAVSGLHVTILFGLIYTLCFKRRWLVVLVSLPMLTLFAAMAGFSPSVVRACVMQGLLVLAMLFDRDYDGPTELAFSCLAMLLANPMVILNVSFQLSVACMVGIFFYNGPISGWMEAQLEPWRKKRFYKPLSWTAKSVAMTLSATVLTTPLVAYYFQTVSLVGVLTNLLTLWVITFIFYGIMAVCLLGWFWPGVAAALAGLIAWPIRYVLGTGKLMAAIPLAAVYTTSVYITCWLVFCYMLLLIFRLSRKKRPGLLFCCCVCGLCMALTASWMEGRFDDCRMTVLDVGQGQCILLQSDGKTFLVDCGGDDGEEAADRAAERLLSQGIFRLDGVILTHYDRDHSGGLVHLLTRIDADAIYGPETEGMAEWAEALGQALIPISQDVELSFGTTVLTIFGPVVPDSGNESSLAVLFQSGNCDILITGDRSDFGERMLIKRTQLPELEILVAGHHGSKNSTGTELLEATKPKIVAISVGENNYYHPAPELLQRLAEYGCIVYRTDRDGNLIFRR